MLSASTEEALNDQVVEGFASAYLYLSLSAWFASEGLPGFAGWLRLQAREEAVHAMKFFDFVIDRGGRVSLRRVDAPDAQPESALAAFERVRSTSGPLPLRSMRFTSWRRPRTTPPASRSCWSSSPSRSRRSGH